MVRAPLPLFTAHWSIFFSDTVSSIYTSQDCQMLPWASYQQSEGWVTSKQFKWMRTSLLMKPPFLWNHQWIWTQFLSLTQWTHSKTHSEHYYIIFFSSTISGFALYKTCLYRAFTNSNHCYWFCIDLFVRSHGPVFPRLFVSP